MHALLGNEPHLVCLESSGLSCFNRAVDTPLPFNRPAAMTHTLNRYIRVTLFTLFAFSIYALQADEGIMQLRRDLFDALDKESVKALERSARFSQTSIDANQAMIDLLDSLPDSDKPVAELMTPEQASEFGVLKQKALLPTMVTWSNSRRQRDIKVISDLLVMIFAEEDWGKEVIRDPANAEFYSKLIEGVDAAMVALEIDELKTHDLVIDDVTSALDQLATRANGSFDTQIQPRIELLQSTYMTRTGKDEFDSSDLDERETDLQQELLKDLYEIRSRVSRRIAIRSLYAIATLENQILEEELITAGGDYSGAEPRIRDIVKQWGQSGEFFLQLVWAINEMVPADLIEEFTEASETSD